VGCNVNLWISMNSFDTTIITNMGK
jgi:hypothetical protein